MPGAADELTASYDEAFARERDGGSFYSAFDEQPAFIEAAHWRRMELLDGLELGDLSDAWCVDYGCGSWGFAAVFPKLHACRRGTGIDISNIALDESRQRIAGDPVLAGRVEFSRSAGDRLDLPTGEIDVLFAGESIEHVVVTPAFVDEVYRCLKPGGRFVVTTPNADSMTYRATGQRFAIGPEHVALMSYAELIERLSPAFEIETALGFNASYLPSVDASLTDRSIVDHWVRQFRDEPAEATCVIVSARPRRGYSPRKWSLEEFHHADECWQFDEPAAAIGLHGRMTGRPLDSGASATLDFSAAGLALLVWSHPWSGVVELTLDGGEPERVELYSPAGGFRRVCFEGLDPLQTHSLVVRSTGDRHPDALGSQVVVHAAVAYSPETA